MFLNLYLYNLKNKDFAYSSMKIIKYILFVIFIYVYFFNPVFQVIGVGLIKILLAISIIYLLISRKYIYLFLLFKVEFFLLSIILLYISPIVILGNGTAYNVPYLHLVWFGECFFIPIFLLFFFNDILKEDTLESTSVIFGLLASLITLFLISSPDINIWLRESVIIDTLDANLTDMYMRGFSIAEGSSFNYGLMQGFILSLCLIQLRKSYLYAIPIIPLFISILFNARIGFSIVIITVILLFLKKRVSFRTIMISLVSTYLSVLLFTNSSFVSQNESSLEWGFSFFEDTFSVLNGGDTTGSNYDVLANDMFFLPNDLSSFLFGEGRSVFSQIGKNSDIGYVNQIYEGGIIYLILLFIFHYYIYRRGLTVLNDKIYGTLFFLSLFIINTKGEAFFISNGFYRLFTLFYVYYILHINGKIGLSKKTIVT